MIPILEVVLLVAFAAAPIMLADYLTVFVTRVLILALLALSFDLVWGYSGIMSFGQALFFGAAGYGVALLPPHFPITSLFIFLLPARVPLLWPLFVFCHRTLSATWAPSADPVLRRVGHAHRLLCGRPAGAGLLLSRGPEWHSLHPADDRWWLHIFRGAHLLLFRS